MRFVAEGGSLVEVTVRTFQSRFLLRPGPSLNETLEVNRLYGWTRDVWDDRYRSILGRLSGKPMPPS